MNVGTKSVLYGAHCFFIHPWFVAWAWTKLYGFPRDWRLWLAFFVHDVGYLGKPNMDGPEGETHVELGAWIMGRLCGPEWGDFCRYHSRFYAKRDRRHFSQLCVADKLAVALEPWWLYLPRVIASGEVHEYMAIAAGKADTKFNPSGASKYVGMNLATTDYRAWFNSMTDYLRRWAYEHQDGRQDTWTPSESSINRPQYTHMPYQDVTADEYERLRAASPAIDLSPLDE